MAELAWVLRGKWDLALDRLPQTHGGVVEAPDLAREALEASRGGGFSDHLVARTGFANGAKEVLTSDGKFGKAEHVQRLK
jgi:predicted nucleic-acid-binding protein